MDDQRIGLALRRVRLRLGRRQQDVADRAGVSQAAYSRIEQGQFDSMTLSRLRRVAASLEVRLDVEPRWRGAELGRLIASGHSRMHERVAELLTGAGWACRPEVSFSHFGERGVVDIVAWHEATRALLIVELKTLIVDINDLLATMDRRRRLAWVIAEPLGWTPATISVWVVVADTRSNRRRLAEHRTVLRSAFPGDGRAVSGWVRHPLAATACLWFLSDNHPTTARQVPTGAIRVPARRRARGVATSEPNHDRHAVRD